MKKLLIILIFLILVGGTTFYFGWIQLHIPPGEYGVVVTKTGGYDDSVITPGAFVWRWENLIPTNLELYTFDITPQIREITSTGRLPSADIYAQNYDIKSDFSYSINIIVSFSIKPEELPILMAEEGLEPEHLPQWYGSIENHIGGVSTYFLKEMVGETDNIDISQFTFSAFEEELLHTLKIELPALNFHYLRVETFDIPDIELYRQTKQNYYDIVEIRHQVFREQIQQETEREAKNIQSIELLREYGKLLSEYPILLKYFALKEDTPGLLEDLSLEEFTTIDREE